MSPTIVLHTDTTSRIHDEAVMLADESRLCRTQLEALATAAGRDMEAAKAELVHALDVTTSPIGEVRNALREQLGRSVACARAARRLLRGARRQQIAAARLLAHLDDQRRDEEAHQRSAAGDAVLVVDDHEEIRELVRRLLERAGFAVRTAANGLEALIVAHEMRPAVIVMDVAMPILDGLEATRLLKAAEATRHARVIAYTATPLDTGPAPDALFVAVLRKPALPDLVVQTVRRAASL
jgi:CheY-like chemotaxis protein